MKHLFSNAEAIQKKILQKSWLEGFVTPDYDEYCITNIPATILEAFGILFSRDLKNIFSFLKVNFSPTFKFIITSLDKMPLSKILKINKLKPKWDIFFEKLYNSLEKKSLIVTTNKYRDAAIKTVLIKFVFPIFL